MQTELTSARTCCVLFCFFLHVAQVSGCGDVTMNSSGKSQLFFLRAFGNPKLFLGWFHSAKQNETRVALSKALFNVCLRGRQHNRLVLLDRDRKSVV